VSGNPVYGRGESVTYVFDRKFTYVSGHSIQRRFSSDSIGHFGLEQCPSDMPSWQTSQKFMALQSLH